MQIHVLLYCSCIHDQHMLNKLRFMPSRQSAAAQTVADRLDYRCLTLLAEQLLEHALWLGS